MHYHAPGVFDLTVPESGAAPLILDSPHSGRDYPRDFTCLIPMSDLRRVEDSYVDALVDFAPDLGATLLSALFPRSYIDANRAESDLDPELILGDWPKPTLPSEKSRLGHGLVWKTYPPNRAMYAGRLPVAAVHRRIEEYWRPYHETLESEIRRLHCLYGAVWHLNCHSMPSTSSPYLAGRAGQRADFVLGDRDGNSCDPEFTFLVKDTLEGLGYSVRLNDPYRGAELVRAYAAPAEGRHSLQIEINRAIYMDERRIEPHRGFDSLRQSLKHLVKTLAAYASSETSPAVAAE